MRLYFFALFALATFSSVHAKSIFITLDGGQCGEFTENKDFIGLAAPEKCKTAHGQTRYVSWTTEGKCIEVSKQGTFIALADANDCRKAIGSKYILIAEGCAEFTPDSYFIRLVDKSACR